jgi:hypothetical protein
MNAYHMKKIHGTWKNKMMNKIHNRWYYIYKNQISINNITYVFNKGCKHGENFLINMHHTNTMRKYRVLQLGWQLGFLVAMDTLCHIQYCIYNVTHMQLYATSLQLISMLNSHTHSNVTNEMPMWHFIHLSTNNICYYLWQLIY